MRLQVTQQGVPEVRLYAARSWARHAEGSRARLPESAGGRSKPFPQLAIQYSELVTSDPIRKLAPRRDRITGQRSLRRRSRTTNRASCFRTSTWWRSRNVPRAARSVAERTAHALSAHILRTAARGRRRAARPRVVQTLVHPHGASVFRARSKTLPIVVFLAVMFATVSLAFMLENARPRLRELDSAEPGAAVTQPRRPRFRAAP